MYIYTIALATCNPANTLHHVLNHACMYVYMYIVLAQKGTWSAALCWHGPDVEGGEWLARVELQRHDLEQASVEVEPDDVAAGVDQANLTALRRPTGAVLEREREREWGGGEVPTENEKK